MGEAEFDGTGREGGIVADAGEAFLLRGGGDAAVDEERGGAIVVEGGDAEDFKTACR